MDDRVRRLMAGEVDALRALRAVYAEAFEDPDSYPPGEPTETYLRAQLENPWVMYWVAESPEGVIVGGLTAYLLPRIHRAVSEVYLYDLAVAEMFRRRGIASRLLDALCEYAGTIGAETIFVQAETEDEPAVALYSKRCVRANSDVIHFDLSLPG
ncbi:MAG: GNAT family N-acetyltransferase [Fimbriimonadaceae bacterium]|nr:GNAT family N-acetyltransferase [Fimbriimonadaceae bacterium]